MEETQTRMLGLAYRLAVDFGTTEVTHQSARALSLLLPGAKYGSLLLEHPSFPSIVSVSNYVKEGLGNIAVHDRETAIAGLVLHKKRPLQGSLSGSSGKVLACLSDVQNMVAEEPTCDFIMCLPIEPSSEAASSSSQVVRGAMLLGFESPPDMGPRRLAATSLLCTLLASSLARTAEDIFSLVSHICGTHMECACPMDGSEDDDDLSEEEGAGSPCKEDKPHPPDAPEPDQRLTVPSDGLARPSTDSAVGAIRYSTDSAFFNATASGQSPTDTIGAPSAFAAGGSIPEEMPARPGKQVSFDASSLPGTSSTPRRSFDYRRSSLSGNREDASLGGSPKASDPEEQPCAKGEMGLDRLSSYDSGALQEMEWVNNWGDVLPRKNTFSKAMLADLELRDLQRLHPMWLTFQKSAVEEEFAKWYAQRQLAVDVMFNMLLLLTMGLLSFHCSTSITRQGLLGRVIALGLTLPLLCIVFARNFYLRYRDVFVVGMRLYMVSLMNLVSLPSLLAHLPTSPLWQCMCFWVLSGGESIFSASLGMQIRMQLHLPLQFAMLSMAACNMPEMCKTCSHLSRDVCIGAAMTVGAGMGFVLPTVLLRAVEVRARGVFGRHVLAAAGLQPVQT